MRRFIAYICMAITILISIGVAFTPIFTKIKPGREFTSGNEIVYHISAKEGEDEIGDDSKAVEEVAEEMRSRLETYKIEDYSVRIEGNDTIRVGLSVEDETVLNYITRYLSFSGGDFSLSGKDEETRLTHDQIFKGSEARIVHKENGLVPYVVFKLSPDNATEASNLVSELVKKVSGNNGDNEESAIHPKKEGEEGATPDIFMWANWVEGDSYEIATEKDQAHMGQKILCSFVSSNIFYKEEKAIQTQNDKEDEEEETPTELQLLCGFAEGEDSSKYDTKKLRQANELATFYTNMFNASKYDFEVENLFVIESASGVTSDTIRSEATIENLLIFGSDVDVKLSATLIATFVAIGVVFLLMLLFYRVAAVGIAANTLGTVFVSYCLFVALGGVFNVAAIVGGVLVAGASLALSILYMNKLKEEVYKGRSLKKANVEAHRKTLLPTIDVSVIAAFSGLMVYFLGGNALRPLGIMLFFGGLVIFVMQLIIFRLLTWLLTNSTNMQSNYKLLNIDEKLVPNVMQEEKPTYVAPYENTDFTKKKKPVAIVTAILAVGAAVVISVFGALNKSPLNVSNASSKKTEVYVSLRGDNPAITTEDAYKQEILDNVYLNGEKLSYSSVDLQHKEAYDYETEITTKYIYFVTTIDSTFKDSDVFSVDEVEYDNLTDALTEQLSTVVDISEIDVSEKVSYETVTAPNQGFVALAAAVAILGSCLYIAFRYRPSRAIGTLAVSSLSALLAYGLLVATRIQTVALSSIVMPVAAFIALVSSIFFLEKEKEMLKDEKSEEKDEEKVMVKATSLAAQPLFITCIVLAYIAINYFAFGQGVSIIFAGMLIAVVLSALLITSLLGPTSRLFHKWLKKIKLPTFKVNRAKKQRIKLQNKPKSSEPEETVFIGIND